MKNKRDISCAVYCCIVLLRDLFRGDPWYKQTYCHEVLQTAGPSTGEELPHLAEELQPFLDYLFNRGTKMIIKFVDNTMVIGLLSNHEHLASAWLLFGATTVNLHPNTIKRGEERRHVHISGMAIEFVSSFKFLGIHS